MRTDDLKTWLNTFDNLSSYRLIALAGDASFRRYFRLSNGSISYIVMDAPPEKEALTSFLQIQTLLQQSGVRVPNIIQKEERLGFLLLEDFGDTLLGSNLTHINADKRYQHAIHLLGELRSCHTKTLPVFNAAFIQQELNLFVEWFLNGLLQIELTPSQTTALSTFFLHLTQYITQQPQCFTHRDYHSRNIMILNSNSSLGLIDFQDACIGPYTYDLVSLLKDCYVQWPKDTLDSFLQYAHQHTFASIQPNFTTFVDDFNITGLQRHLKVLGIFSRLHLRDQKSNYLNDLPLTFHYVVECLNQYKAFSSIATLFKTIIEPAFNSL